MAVFVGLAVISVLRDLSWGWPSTANYIGNGDAAHMAGIARNIAEGRGALATTHWLLTDGGLPDPSLPYPETYWSVYVAAFVGAVMRVAGAHVGSVLLTASLVKVAMAAAAARLSHAAAGPWAALGVAATVLFDPLVIDRVDGLADIYWAATSTITFVALGWAIRRPSAIEPWFVAGLATGLGAGFRLTAVLQVPLIAIVALVLLARRKGRPLRGLVVAAGTSVLGVLPYLLFNLVRHGGLLPPGVDLVRRAAEIRRVTGNHNFAFYGFDATRSVEGTTKPLMASVDTIQDLWAGVLQGQVLPLWLVALLGLSTAIVLWQTARRRLEQPTGAVWGLFLGWVVLAIALTGIVHFEARYWTFLIPVTAVAVAVGLGAAHRLTPLLMVVGVAVSLALSPAPAAFSIDPIPTPYLEMASALPPDAIVLSSNPWQYSFHTDRPTVAVPYGESPALVEEVAAHYGATHLAVIGTNLDGSGEERVSDVRHPDLREALFEAPPGWQVAARAPKWILYELPAG